MCINHWKVLYKLRVFYVDRNSKMTTTAGHSFYIGPIGSFYNQVNSVLFVLHWSKIWCSVKLFVSCDCFLQSIKSSMILLPNISEK
jgi:hypothetical protein